MLLKKSSRKFQFKVLAGSIAGLLFGPQLALASACCGGALALPSLITRDEKALLTQSLSVGRVQSDVDARGYWTKKSDTDETLTLKIEGAALLSDRWQSGGSMPIVTRSGSRGSSTNPGDFSAQIGYEFLPEWSYHPWRPRGVGSLTLTAPTVKSIYETNDSSITTGRGFWTLGAGAAFTRAWIKWDSQLTLEAHKSFDRQVSTAGFEGRIKPGFGASLSAGAGYHIGQNRVGFAISSNHEDRIDAEGSVISTGSSQRWMTGTLSASHNAGNDWSWTLSYSDQTLLGDPSNTSLSKTWAFALQKRWAR